MNRVVNEGIFPSAACQDVGAKSTCDRIVSTVSREVIIAIGSCD